MAAARRRRGNLRRQSQSATLDKGMIDQSEFRWLRRHTVVAPFGIFAVTLALAWWERVLPWPSVGPAETAELVDLAAIIYGMIAVLSERGVRVMFWALDQRRQWRERWRQEARAEGREQERAAMKAHLERVAREKGIDLDELLPRDKE